MASGRNGDTARFTSATAGKGRQRSETESMTAWLDDKKCSIWFRALKYTVLSARSDRATGPPVRGSMYVWIIALSMPKFASRQDRPDTAVSSYIHSACLR